ncbi:hypothetical protein BGZ60DRAFT_70049 [Tricladium varicosporioides]|nr:hypothetical protein BGZ60DRAFT_70049 [Hymenoscyphus varicosporioides]
MFTRLAVVNAFIMWLCLAREEGSLILEGLLFEHHSSATSSFIIYRVLLKLNHLIDYVRGPIETRRLNCDAQEGTVFLLYHKLETLDRFHNLKQSSSDCQTTLPFLFSGTFEAILFYRINRHASECLSFRH